MPDEPAVNAATPCPACAGRLYPRLLKCADCGLEVTTRYATNEFADLEPESLHLLRIFVLCEGRIRDMEAALGVSYPTVKTRLAALREALGLTGAHRAETRSHAAEESSSAAAARPRTVRDVLDALEAGALDYPQAMALIRSLRSGT